jgi:CspA family cold shock protein
MTKSTPPVVCQRCGRGFMVTEAHRDFSERRGIPVIAPVLCMACFLNAGPLPKELGRVKWFNPRKRYGFIAINDDQDIFVHQNQVLGNGEIGLHEGQVVRFHIHHSPKGLEAWNVELAE